MPIWNKCWWMWIRNKLFRGTHNTIWLPPCCCYKIFSCVCVCVCCKFLIDGVFFFFSFLLEIIMSNRNITSATGLVFSFIGMAGLVLTIISLIPLNTYNSYTTLDTLLKLISFEQERTGQDDWHNIQLSPTAKLYFIFLSSSFISSVLVILTTLVACCRHQTFQHANTNSAKYEKIIQHKSWFLRFTCLTLLIQMATSIFGKEIAWQ